MTICRQQRLPSLCRNLLLRAFLLAFNTGELAALRRSHEAHGGNPSNADMVIIFFANAAVCSCIV